MLEKCYRPLLDAIESAGWPCGIEFSGLTLRSLRSLDPGWIERLKHLVGAGLVEVIGSGFTQLIGPLVPAGVNQKNVELGWKTYRDILDIEPTIALVPEQAFSSGLLDVFGQFGLSAFVMEWNNPRAVHPEWPADHLYRPRLVRSQSGTELPVIWNHSVAFQRFQRFAHGENTVQELVDWLGFHHGQTVDGSLSLYGNDAEIFDFRPGRYQTEAPVHPSGEWKRIKELIRTLHADGRFSMVLPSDALSRNFDHQSEPISLESSVQPIAVKKQRKYNITRWAVTGIDDYSINSWCHQVASSLLDRNDASEPEWERLLMLWSSDFRTHITAPRWSEFSASLESAVEELKVRFPTPEGFDRSVSGSPKDSKSSSISLSSDSRFLTLESERVRVKFNLFRGLAIHSFTDRNLSVEPIFGSIPIGEFEDIRLAADWYSGNLTFERPGRPQVTDLLPVEPHLSLSEKSAEIAVELATDAGSILKVVTVDSEFATIHVRYSVRFDSNLGSLRFGYLTLFDHLDLDAPSLYKTHLGGPMEDTFWVQGVSLAFGDAVSSRVSATNGLGATEGEVSVSNGRFQVKSKLDSDSKGAIGLIHYQEDTKGKLFRHFFSAREFDDTSQGRSGGLSLDFGLTYSCSSL